jgi:large subunit ribosomal protein L32
MPVPYRRKSSSRARMRRSHDALSVRAATTCSNCAEPVLPHHVCRACGFYKGEQVIGSKEEVTVEDQEVAAE